MVPKYKRKALEKIWNLLQEIEEKHQISIGNKVEISKENHRLGPIDQKLIIEENQTRKGLLDKLVELEALEDLTPINKEGIDYWLFSLTSKFDSIFNDYKDQYEEAAISYKQRLVETKTLEEDVSYYLVYSPVSREITINGFLIAKPDFNSENEVVFKYLYEHPNQMLTISEIEKETRRKVLKRFHKIVENLGFNKDLKKAFFGVSKNTIMFRNPVGREILKDLGISRIKIG